MNTVFAVSEGEYSGYMIHALFPTRELAEAHAAAITDGHGHGDPFVEEFAFYDEQPKRLTWYEMKFDMFDNGKCSNNTTGVYERKTWDYEAPFRISRRPRIKLLESHPRDPQHMGYEIQYGLFGECLDEAPLLKIVSDTKAQWIAQGHLLHHAEPWH